MSTAPRPPLPDDHHIAFGPIPSRRLGNSLGVNNIPAKACSYTCLYCQVGPTTEKLVEPQRFFSVEQIHEAVAARIERLRAAGQKIDYLSLVPDGEPTLDAALGEIVDALRSFGIPVAVITNSTLLWREAVRARLGHADLVSVKVDSTDETACFSDGSSSSSNKTIGSNSPKRIRRPRSPLPYR